MAQSPEQKKSYQVIKQFTTVNTKANRTAIQETEFSWLENAMPIGYSNLKITGQRSAITDNASNAVVFSANVTYLSSVNIGLNDYVVAFKDDGSAQGFNLQSKQLVTIGNAGKFSNAGIAVSQWKNQDMLIIDPNKGYYVWDGNNTIFVGSVGQIALISGGSAYTAAPSVVISAPNDANGIQATAVAAISNNAVTSVTLTEAGSGYTQAPTIQFYGGGGTGANAVASIVTFATGTVSIAVTNPGDSYTGTPTVNISGGGGTGASATAVVNGNAISTIVMTNPGTGYTNSANLVVSLSGGGGANATIAATINNTPNVDVASFSGRVWIAAGRQVYYSAAGTYNDFTSVSAGNILLTDSTLHGNLYKLLAANNFLYLFGDDSINVFSDVRVQTDGTTLFTNTNVSASVGSKRPDAIFPYFRSVLFMNDYGVYALVGSTTSKISDPLDGIFPNIDFTYPVYAGQVLVNNILCAAFNFRYFDAVFTNSYRYIQAVFFEKKWFFTSQGNNLQYITSAPVSGKVNLYGTENSALYQLYADKTSSVSSIIQTALMPMNDPIRDKQALKFGVEVTTANSTIFNVTVDSQQGSSPPYTLQNNVLWYNNVGTDLNWINNSSQVIYWLFTSGYYLYKSDAQQWGKYLGLTLTSNSAAFVVNTFEFEHELRARF
jgi:hypothetical protein